MFIVTTAQLLMAAGSRISTIRCLTVVQSFPSCGWELILATSHSHGSLLRRVGKRGPVWVPRCRATERANPWIYWEHMGSGASWLRADAQHWLIRPKTETQACDFHHPSSSRCSFLSLVLWSWVRMLQTVFVYMLEDFGWWLQTDTVLKCGEYLNTRSREKMQGKLISIPNSSCWGPGL